MEEKGSWLRGEGERVRGESGWREGERRVSQESACRSPEGMQRRVVFRLHDARLKRFHTTISPLPPTTPRASL